MIKCLHDEVKWGEWGRHCDAALGYFSWQFRICGFDLWLVECADAEAAITKGWLYYTILYETWASTGFISHGKFWSQPPHGYWSSDNTLEGGLSASGDPGSLSHNNVNDLMSGVDDVDGWGPQWGRSGTVGHFITELRMACKLKLISCLFLECSIYYFWTSVYIR